jgi:hypothetical protein
MASGWEADSAHCGPFSALVFCTKILSGI